MEHIKDKTYARGCRCRACKDDHSRKWREWNDRKTKLIMETTGTTNLDQCTYFDQRNQCTVCGVRPVMRKTGKCAPHSVAPYDMSRVDDWIDCYEGCLKHDPHARKRYAMRKHRADKGTPKVRGPYNKSNYTSPTPLPTLNKLFLIHRQSPDIRSKLIADTLFSAFASRNVSLIKIGIILGNRGEEYVRNRLKRYKADLSFIEVCECLEYLSNLDQQKKMGEYKK